MEITILSLFPDYFLGPFNESIIKQAQKNGLLSIQHVNIRDFSEDKHRKVDDRPYGGGPGMVLMPEPVSKAIEHVKKPHSKVIYLSPQGQKLDAKKCRELSQNSHLILLCGHYEGVDERIITHDVDEEISIGDFVLTNGGLAAIVLVDALVRFIPNVLGHADSAEKDSFQNHLLDHPHYTRPELFRGDEVPKVLLEGNHEKIASWRHKQSIEKTEAVRPDLYLDYLRTQHPPAENRESVPLDSGKILLPVKNLSATVRFYRKLLPIENEQIQFGHNFIQFFESPLTHAGIVLQFKAHDPQLLRQIAYKLRQTGYLIKEAREELSFKDPDGYLWILYFPFVDKPNNHEKVTLEDSLF